jgi:LysR family transcriptional regulator, pca operon transcriptional activator
MDKDVFKNRIRLRHLDCFICVAQTSHVGKAADKLRMSQPAVSKTLSELEEIVGLPLLVRNRQGSRLTREGENFLRHAVAVTDALSAAHASFGAKVASTAESIFVGALPTVAPDLLPPALQAFRTDHADARVVFQTGTNNALLQLLKTGEVDLVLGRLADPEMMVGLTFELLYVEPLVLAVRPGHPLDLHARVSLADVLDYQLVVSPRNTIPRHNTESLFRASGLRLPAHCVETLDVSLARQIVLQTDAVWCTPLGAVRNDSLHGMVSTLKLSTAGVEEPVGLLKRSDAELSLAASAFVGCLLGAASELRAGKQGDDRRSSAI